MTSVNWAICACEGVPPAGVPGVSAAGVPCAAGVLAVALSWGESGTAVSVGDIGVLEVVVDAMIACKSSFFMAARSTSTSIVGDPGVGSCVTFDPWLLVEGGCGKPGDPTAGEPIAGDPNGGDPTSADPNGGDDGDAIARDDASSEADFSGSVSRGGAGVMAMPGGAMASQPSSASEGRATILYQPLLSFLSASGTPSFLAYLISSQKGSWHSRMYSRLK
mmetsp:Transcript_107896/g.186707  ORF Transcript_107896/g.186707 Transcript_107896/m.186707 type:complete len:220 (+) Transcript_107896:811-1470(+)